VNQTNLHKRKETAMKKRMLLLGFLLGVFVLISSCTPGGGGSVSLVDAQIALFSVTIPMGLDALSLKGGGGVAGTPPAAPGDLFRVNNLGTLSLYCSPTALGPSSTMTTTATGYDTASTPDFIVSGTIVEVRDASNYYTGTYNLSVSSSLSPVKTITGALTGPGGSATGGTLYFNGTGYTKAELGI
jgi:hypothetical protein